MPAQHETVLLAEAVDGLAIVPDGIYIDGTFGRGGHSAAILARLGAHGRLIALDRDPAAVRFGAQGIFKDPRFCMVHTSFAALGEIARQHGFFGKAQGLLLDLGVSSPQLDEAERGFSFGRDGPLDMRMNPDVGMDAATWVNQASAVEISDVLYRYGEERYSRRIARAIVAARGGQRIETTLQLSEIVKKAHPAWERRIHPATRTFQAIRILINGELEALEQVLQQSLEVLAPGGRLCVISFHSLEDRAVKQFIRQQMTGDAYPPDLPIRNLEDKRRIRRVGSLIKATAAEVANNARARSARLRIAEKIK